MYQVGSNSVFMPGWSLLLSDIVIQTYIPVKSTGIMVMKAATRQVSYFLIQLLQD